MIAVAGYLASPGTSSFWLSAHSFVRPSVRSSVRCFWCVCGSCVSAFYSEGGIGGAGYLRSLKRSTDAMPSIAWHGMAMAQKDGV